MTMLDLQPFCYHDTDRPYLRRPFSLGDFSYATDGNILVRVPRRGDVVEYHGPEMRFDRAIERIDVAAFHCFDPVIGDVDVCDRKACPDCRGAVPVCMCAECRCACGHNCEEVEQVRGASVVLGGCAFQLAYVRMVAAIPGVEVAITARADPLMARPLLFRFGGGVGGLMPMSTPFALNAPLVWSLS